jgi:RNA-directed DNA polymerase
MTHGREKSDSAIVAGKPTNNVERSTAVPAEPRAEAEGNASQQSTCRAQDWESVSQALERIRQAARQRKKEKFTALFHHLTIDLLEDAFDELKKDAAAGVDGLTWKEYDANLKRNLEDLHARLHRGAYRALPSRRVYIPKPDGRQRPLAVAALHFYEPGDGRGGDLAVNILQRTLRGTELPQNLPRSYDHDLSSCAHVS